MADRKHWESRVKPLPEKRHVLPYGRSFDQAEVSLLGRGLLPQSQDDRRVVLLHDGSLDIYRSWTGHCIYSLPLKPVASGLAAEAILVNGDEGQYRRGDERRDYEAVEMLIGRVLSRRAS